MYALECGDYSDVIAWSSASCRAGGYDGGDMFHILDVRAFTEQVLPALFKSVKFESFHRKMYRWGFSKQRTTTRAQIRGDAVAAPFIFYSHQNFRKGNFTLASSMTCSGPGSASNRIRSAFTSPNINGTAPMGNIRFAAGDAGGGGVLQEDVRRLFDDSREETRRPRSSPEQDMRMMDDGHGAPDVQLVLTRSPSQVTGACSTMAVAGSPTSYIPRPPDLLLTDQGGYYAGTGDAVPAPASISCQDRLTRSISNTRTSLYQAVHSPFAVPHYPYRQLHQYIHQPIHSRTWYSDDHLRRDPASEDLLIGVSSSRARSNNVVSGSTSACTSTCHNGVVPPPNDGHPTSSTTASSIIGTTNAGLVHVNDQNAIIQQALDVLKF